MFHVLLRHSLSLVIVATASLGPVRGDQDAITDRLLKSSGATRGRLLTEYRDANGAEYTTALVAAVGQWQGADRDAARAALVRRLGQVSSGTLCKYMTNPNPELRRAAAIAAGTTGTSEVPVVAKELINLLRDVDPEVVQAARSGLKALSKQDHGPEPGAEISDRLLAIRAWERWRNSVSLPPVAVNPKAAAKEPARTAPARVPEEEEDRPAEPALHANSMNAQTTETNDGPDFTIVLAAAGLILGSLVVALVGIVYVAIGTESRCPECRRLYSLVFVGKEVVSRERAYGLVTRTMHHNERRWAYPWGGPPILGTSSGTSTSSERVPVVVRVIKTTHVCKHCGHEEAEFETREQEDFDRP